jgi:predicted site-specific integrase-resolvase
MSTMSAIPGYKTIAEAARRFQVSHAQFSRYISSNLIKAVTVGQQKFIRDEDLEKFSKPLRGNPNFRLQSQDAKKSLKKKGKRAC